MNNYDRMVEEFAKEIIQWEPNQGFVIHPLVVSEAFHSEEIRDSLFRLVDMLVEEYEKTDPNIMFSAELLKKVFSAKEDNLYGCLSHRESGSQKY